MRNDERAVPVGAAGGRGVDRGDAVAPGREARDARGDGVEDPPEVFQAEPGDFLCGERDEETQDRDAEHGHIIQRVEIVLREAAPATSLPVMNMGLLEPDVADEAAEIRIGIVYGTKDVDDLAVVESEAGRVLDKLDFGEAANKIVIALPKKEHDP